MANVNVNKAGSPLDTIDNPVNSELLDYVKATREFKPAAERLDWRVEAVRAVALIVAVTVGWGLWGIWKIGYCWNLTNYGACRTIAALEPLGALVAVVIVVGLPAWRVAVWAQGELLMARARAARTATTFDRFGNPQRVDLLLPLAEAAARYRLDVELKARTAPYEWAHSINTFSPSTLPAKDAPALPAPGMPSVPPAQWLGWINSLPHVLLAAETGGGKSTTAKHILAPRLAGGEDVFIIDPHSSQWYDLPSVGGGENWPIVEQAIGAVEREYRARLEYREAYRRETGRELPVTSFTRLTVVLDEANNARLALDRAPRGKLSTWQRFTQVMGSGARKVNISLLLMAQSANADDIGLSAAMRENFTRVALDSAAARKLIMAEETNPERRKALAGLLEGREYPAVCEFRGQVHALDRSGLDRAPDVSDARASAWQGWDYLTDSAVRPSSEDADDTAATTQTNQTGSDRPQMDAALYKETMVIGLKRAGLNRSEIRQQLVGLGLTLDNNEYSAILARHGLS